MTGATAPLPQSPAAIGDVYLNLAAAKDATTLFWACQEGGRPISARWRPNAPPWRVTLPLELPDLGLPPPAEEGAGAAGGAAAAAARPPATVGSDYRRAPAGTLTPSDAGNGNGASSIGHAADGSRGAAAAAKQQEQQRQRATQPQASITLLLSADPWVYKQDNASTAHARSGLAGKRCLVIQLMEARDLAASDWAGTCDPYVRLSYDGRTYRTRTIYNTKRPVWQQAFVILDNPSRMTRQGQARGTEGAASVGDRAAPRRLAARAEEATIAANGVSGERGRVHHGSAPAVRFSCRAGQGLCVMSGQGPRLAWQGGLAPPACLLSGAASRSPPQLHLEPKPPPPVALFWIRPSASFRRLALDVFDSGVSRDERLGSFSLNLDMASEYSLQVFGGGRQGLGVCVCGCFCVLGRGSGAGRRPTGQVPSPCASGLGFEAAGASAL